MSEMGLLLAEIQALKRRIQALETVSEHPGFAASDVARLSQNNTFSGIQTIPNTGLHLLDTNASHDLIIAPGSDLSADVTLSLVMTANRTLTLSGNATLNQDVSTAGSPAFAQVNADNLRLDGNTLSSTSGGVNVTPLAGQNLTMTISGAGIFDVRGAYSYFGQDGGNTYIFGNTFNFANHVDANSSGWINYSGYAAGATRFRDLNIGDGKNTSIAFFDGSAGSVGIGTIVPTAKTHIDQASTTAAIPVLTLDQADLSEEFINFVGTVGTGNSIEAVGAKSLTTTHFLRMQIDGVGYVYVPAGTIA